MGKDIKMKQSNQTRVTLVTSADIGTSLTSSARLYITAPELYIWLLLKISEMCLRMLSTEAVQAFLKGK